MGTIAVGERVAGEAERVPALEYRPYLDGLRAVAVYLVVLFHAGSGVFSGGYIGVDVFFVLSGFLVTQLLLRDLGRTGKIRFGRFYSRRFRRLLPAAFVALIVTAIVYTAIAAPAEVLDAVGSFKAAFLYVTNWYFIRQSTGYFGANISANPVLPFWSLAIEEQFYLLWPLTLGALFWITRRLDHPRRTRTLQLLIGAGALASAIWALSLRNANPNRAYYGTDARAYELLAGALLALTPTLVTTAKQHHRVMRAAAIAATAALIYLATSWNNYDAIVRGIAVTITTAILLIALEAANGGIIKRALSHDRVTYLGRISYGTYLWHWLVIIVAARTFHLSTITTIAIAATVATALAALSYEMLERPIRQSPLLDQHRKTVITTGLTLSIISALIFIPTIVDPAHATTPTLQNTTNTNTSAIPAGFDWRVALRDNHTFVDCYQAPVDKCTVVHGTGPHIMLIGDSHAAMMIPTFTAIAQQEHLTLSIDVRGGCPWQRNLFATPITFEGTTLREQDCRNQKEDMYKRVIPALHPDIIIAMNVGHEDPTQLPFLGPNDVRLFNGTAAMTQWLNTTTKDSVRELRATGARLLLIEPVPATRFDPLTCLSKAKTFDECRYVASATPDVLEVLYRELAKQHNGVWSADLDRLVCPYLPICDPVVNGIIVKWDSTHLTNAFAKSLAPYLDTYLKQTGLLRS